LSLSEITGRIQNVSFGNDLSPDKQNEVRKAVEDKTLPIMTMLASKIGSTTNQQLHNEAGSEAATLGNLRPGISPYFLLQMFIGQVDQGQQERDRPLVFLFEKDSPVSPPIGCTHSVECNVNVRFLCADLTNTAFILRRLLASQEWSTVAVDAAIPRFVFPALWETNVTGNSSDVYRVCFENDTHDLGCTDPVTVDLPRNVCQSGDGKRRCGGDGPRCFSKDAPLHN
jgi:hypothetical protein